MTKRKDTPVKHVGDILHDLVVVTHEQPRKSYERTRVTTDPVGKTRTQASHAPECDINRIVGNYQRTGVISHVNSKTPQYGDFSHSQDFHSALTAVREAQRDFAALPANVRAACDNNPEKFLELMHNPENREQADQLGLKGIFDSIHEIPDENIPEETTSSPPDLAVPAKSETAVNTPAESTSPTLDKTGTTDNSQ